MELAENEKVLGETPFGIGPMAGTATLTERRVVLAARDYEETIPLRAITSVRCAFSRDFSAAVWGALILALALAFAVTYKSMETAANGVALALEKRVTEKQPAAEAYGHYFDISPAWVWLLMLPVMGWGAVKLGAGLLGTTALSLSTASETVGRSRPGRQRELMEFAEEVGRRTAASDL